MRVRGTGERESTVGTRGFTMKEMGCHYRILNKEVI